MINFSMKIMKILVQQFNHTCQRHEWRTPAAQPWAELVSFHKALGLFTCPKVTARLNRVLGHGFCSGRPTPDAPVS